MQRINHNIPSSVLEEQVVHVLSKSDSPVLIQNNRQFQRFLLEGVPVQFNNGDKPVADHARLVDFQNVYRTSFWPLTSLRCKAAS